MRIPVTRADLDSRRFTKISRTLIKSWPHGKLSLMQAQGILAQMLGYRSLHDLQEAVKSGHAVASPGVALSRAQIIAGAAWKLSRHASIPLAAASLLAEGLGLSTLEADAATQDANFERTFEHMRRDSEGHGKMLMLDESPAYLNPPWEPMTPLLLDWGVPPYEFAVLRDGSAFSWHVLTGLLSRLPEGYTEELAQEEAYQQATTNDAITRQFVSNELIPQAFSPLASAIKRDKRMPNGFAIRWLFNEERRCLGRVIENWMLGGVVPVVFDADSDAIFDALAEIMCGRAVTASSGPLMPVPGVSGDPVRIMAYLSAQLGGGFDLREDLSCYSYSRSGEPLDFELRPLGIPLSFLGQHAALDVGSGGTFVEQGQTYVRHQQSKFLVAVDIPDWMRADARLNTLQLRLNVLQPMGRGAIPDPLAALRNVAKETLRTKLQEARSRAAARTPDELALVAHAHAVPEALDGYLGVYVGEHVGEDPAWLQRLGGEIKALCPSLQPYSNLTLGGLSKLIEDSDNPKSPDDVQDLFPALVVMSAFCAAEVDIEDACRVASAESFLLVCEMLIERRTSTKTAFADALALAKFNSALARHDEAVRSIQRWREEASRQDKIRAEGTYLYAKEPLSREKPKTMLDMVSRVRSYGHRPILAKQSWQDFQREAAGKGHLIPLSHAIARTATDADADGPPA